MVHEYVYTLGLAGNRTKVEEFRYDEGSSRPALAERTVRYIYDDLYRLVHEIVTVKNSAGTGTQWQRTDTFTYDKVGNRKTMQRKTINQQTDVLYDYNAADQLLCETATTLQREAGGGYAAAPRPTRFAGVALGSIAALAFACLLAPFALLRTSGQGRKAQRNRRFVACVSAFFVPLMAIDPSHVYALHKEAMAYQALAAAGLATVDPNTQVTTYDYDANGNMVEKVVDNPSAGIKTTLYTYDAENRLATVDDGSGVGGVVSYTYDADGIRTSKLVGVTLTTYVVDKNRPYAQVLEERLEVGGVSTVVKRYVYGHDLISQTDSPGDGQYASTSYFHYDGQMSTRALSQGATVISDPTPAPLGSVIAKYSYDAFGSSLDLQGNLLPAGSTSATDYLYTGEQHDANAGFYYLRARYYSPGVGRFITRDTYQGSQHDPGSLHKYLYANANPLDNIDPSGLFALALINLAGMMSMRLLDVASRVHPAVFMLTARCAMWLWKLYTFIPIAVALLTTTTVALQIMDTIALSIIESQEKIIEARSGPVAAGEFVAVDRGRKLEQMANVNLGGNFPRIDHFERNVGLQFRSHAQSTANGLYNAIRNDCRKLSEPISDTLRGVTRFGQRVKIKPDQIHVRALAVVIPRTNAAILTSPGFTQRLASLANEFRVIIRPVVARTWILRR